MTDPSMAAPRVKIWPWFLVGGLAVGTVDGLFASTWWKIAADVAPSRVFQSVAAGLLGKASFEGGPATAWLGLGLHYFIATTMSLVYLLASRKLPSLVHHSVRNGLLYGLVLYVVMTFVVVPLSAKGPPASHNLPWEAASVVMHLVFGSIIAGVARRAAR